MSELFFTVSISLRFDHDEGTIFGFESPCRIPGAGDDVCLHLLDPMLFHARQKRSIAGGEVSFFENLNLKHLISSRVASQSRRVWGRVKAKGYRSGLVRKPARKLGHWRHGRPAPVRRGRRYRTDVRGLGRPGGCGQASRDGRWQRGHHVFSADKPHLATLIWYQVVTGAPTGIFHPSPLAVERTGSPSG